jgi:predicted thioesterase
VRYAVGSRVCVQVSRVNVEGRRIDFRLAPADQNPTPRARPSQARLNR